MANSLTYRELALGSFTAGVIGLGLAIPGYLSNWNEYRVCQTIYSYQDCKSQAYSWQEAQPQNLELIGRYVGEPLTKSLGIGLAVVAFPLAAWASRLTAENCEFSETVDAIEKTAAIQSQMQQHSIDNKVNADGYEAMKSFEMADAIQRFTETFYKPVTVDDIEAQIETESQRLQQSQNYKTLEFDTTTQNQTFGRNWSEQAQNFYAWLMNNEKLPETINSDWIGKQSFDGSKLKKEQWLPLAREIIAEGLANWIEEDKSFKLL